MCAVNWPLNALLDLFSWPPTVTYDRRLGKHWTAGVSKKAKNEGRETVSRIKGSEIASVAFFNSLALEK